MGVTSRVTCCDGVGGDGVRETSLYPVTPSLPTPSPSLRLDLIRLDDAVDGVAGVPDLGVVRFVDLDQHAVLADLDDLAELPADRLDLVATLQLAEHVLSFLLLALLAAEDDDVHDHADQDQRGPLHELL